MISGVIYNVLNDALGAGEVGAYNGGKAIFAGMIPDNSTYPAVVINEVGGRSWGYRQKDGSEVEIDVQVFGDKDKSLKSIRDLAKKIYETLNRSTLGDHIANAGYVNAGCYASWPASTNDGLGFPGLTIRLMVRVQKAS